MTCYDCGGRLEHCHGTLVRHLRDVREVREVREVVVECTEPDCTTPELACHALVVESDELARL